MFSRKPKAPVVLVKRTRNLEPPEEFERTIQRLEGLGGWFSPGERIELYLEPEVTGATRAHVKEIRVTLVVDQVEEGVAGGTPTTTDSPTGPS